jgi:ABC-type phosphate/phosphonate transport system substrate-binding protein
VEDKVKVIGYTEEIPNEPWVIRSGLFADPQENEKVKGYVVEALEAYAASPAGKKAIDELAGATGIERVSDASYDKIREVIIANKDLNLEETVKKGK